jgi:hypothetical protein
MATQRRQRLIYAFIAIVAIVAAVFGTTNGRFLGVTPTEQAPVVAPTPTPADPVDAQPAPALFTSKDLLPIGARLTRQYRLAESDIDDFYADQPTGSTVDDAAFADWASKQVGLRPSGRLPVDIAQSAKRDRAARWLGLHGCRDVWTSYVLAQKRFHAADAQVAKKSELGAVVNLAVRITTSAQKRLARGEDVTAQAPCAPSDAAARAACDCSFPSSTAAMSAAARTYLAALEPMASRQYAWMERQVDLAQVYQGLELPTDTEAGAYVGYLVARYYLASRGYPEPTPTRQATTTP